MWQRKLQTPAIFAFAITAISFVVRGVLEEYVFSSLTEELEANAWILGDFIAWRWSPLVLGGILFGGIWLAASSHEPPGDDLQTDDLTTESTEEGAISARPKGILDYEAALTPSGNDLKALLKDMNEAANLIQTRLQLHTTQFKHIDGSMSRIQAIVSEVTEDLANFANFVGPRVELLDSAKKSVRENWGGFIEHHRRSDPHSESLTKLEETMARLTQRLSLQATIYRGLRKSFADIEAEAQRRDMGDAAARAARVADQAAGGLEATVAMFQELSRSHAEANDNVANTTVSADDDGAWAWLRVDNHGPTAVFRVSVEWQGEANSEKSYHPPWRDGNVEDQEIVKGDHAVVNIAQAAPDASDMNLLIRAKAGKKAVIRFLTTSNSEGHYYKLLDVGSEARCRIIVFDKQLGPVTDAKEYILQVVDEKTIHFFDRPMEKSETPSQGSPVTNDTQGTDKYVGDGVWSEVKWKGWKVPNGHIRAEGPLCKYDDGELLFRTHTPGGTPVKDYHEVAPPESHLYCPACNTEYYLGATEKKAARVGDARANAAWRLGGGRTHLEKLVDQAFPYG